MKLLLLNQAFHPDVASTAQHLTDLALELSQRGHEVTVVASRRAYDDPNQRFPKRERLETTRLQDYKTTRQPDRQTTGQRDNQTTRPAIRGPSPEGSGPSSVVSGPVVRGRVVRGPSPGIEIHRIWSTGFGKGAKWRRGLDFASFIVACCWRLLWLPRFDVVVALTSPPLISCIGACFAKWKRARFLYWVMDLNPDEAVAAGWLREGAAVTRLLDALSRFSLKRADKVIALDRFMSERIARKGIARIAVIPPWSHDDVVRFDEAGRDKFRRAHGLDGKFVVMYSGNHSPCHPLDTLLQAASRLADRKDIVFCFVGGGSEFRKIQKMAAAITPTRNDSVGNGSATVPVAPVGVPPSGSMGCETSPNSALAGNVFGGTPKTAGETPALPTNHSLAPIGGEGRGEGVVGPPSSVVSGPWSSGPWSRGQILCLPYQPLNELAGSLSAADLHVVVMGDPFVGTIHPCKIYNILAVASPVLYIGPRPSHVSEVFDVLGNPSQCRWAQHGDVDAVVRQITELAQSVGRLDGECASMAARFSKQTLLPRLVGELEAVGGRR